MRKLAIFITHLPNGTRKRRFAFVEIAARALFIINNVYLAVFLGNYLTVNPDDRKTLIPWNNI